MVTLSFTIFSRQKNLNRAHMLFQVLCGFEPIFYTTHPNEEPLIKEKLVKKNVCTASKKARSKNLTFGGGIFIFHEFNIHQSQKNQYTDYHKYLT